MCSRGAGTGRPSPCLALLRVGFAEPPGSPRALVRSYRTVSPLPVPTSAHRGAAIGGLFSVALSCGSPRLAVSQHPALWSPDLPRPGHRPEGDAGRGHPAGSPSPVSVPAGGRRTCIERPFRVTGCTCVVPPGRWAGRTISLKIARVPAVAAPQKHAVGRRTKLPPGRVRHGERVRRQRRRRPDP